MDIICSPAGIVNPDRPGQGIMDIVNAGFKHMSLELDMCCSSYELEHFGEPEPEEKGEADNDLSLRRRGVRREFEPVSENPSEMRRFFKRLTEACGGQLDIPLALAPYLPRDIFSGDTLQRDTFSRDTLQRDTLSGDTLQRDTLSGDTKRMSGRGQEILERLAEIDREAIRYCGSLGCGYIVIRPISLTRAEGDGWQVNRDFYLSLASAARESRVKILLVNQYVLKNGHAVRGVCSDGDQAARWVDRLNREAGEEVFGFCVDVGVCSLCGQDMYEFACALGGRVKAVIFRDCDGSQEGSMLPFTAVCHGQPRTDWLSLIRGLRRCGFDGQILLSMYDTAVSFSPLLRPQLMSLARTAAEYFKWQIEIENVLKKYDSIVLFGAGNMCRNYMKCYGEMYPPLFTCDNNKNIWGTEFCGLEVRPPEALKSVPENCGVLICNIYYREIEKQLKDMGIEHVEFFNDEYMPTFHFDRLKGV